MAQKKQSTASALLEFAGERRGLLVAPATSSPSLL